MRIVYRKSLEGGCAAQSSHSEFIAAKASGISLGLLCGGSGLQVGEPWTKETPGLGLVDSDNWMALRSFYLCYQEPLTPGALV